MRLVKNWVSWLYSCTQFLAKGTSLWSFQKRTHLIFIFRTCSMGDKDLQTLLNSRAKVKLAKSSRCITKICTCITRISGQFKVFLYEHKREESYQSHIQIVLYRPFVHVFPIYVAKVASCYSTLTCIFHSPRMRRLRQTAMMGFRMPGHTDTRL